MTRDRPKGRNAYKSALRDAQERLVKLQRHVIETDQKVLLIFEGRDAAGKDGTIKRIVEHLSPRDTRVVALGKLPDRDRKSWYFQRYVAHFPAAGELVLFNRSWDNRAGVERGPRLPLPSVRPAPEPPPHAEHQTESVPCVGLPHGRRADRRGSAVSGVRAAPVSDHHGNRDELQPVSVVANALRLRRVAV